MLTLAMSTRPAAGPRDCLTDDPPPRRGGAPRPGLARVLAALYDTTAEQAAGGLARFGVGPMIDHGR